MSIRSLTPRERVFIVLGAFVLAALAHGALRLLPLRQALRNGDAEVARLETALASRRQGAPGDPEIARLLHRREELRASIEGNRADVARLASHFSRDEGTALAAVSDLAARSGVLVRESSRESTPGEGSLARPRRRFVVVTTFEALRAFVAGLPSLSAGPVHLQRLDIETVSLPPEDGIEALGADPHVLVATLVLVL